MRMMFYFLGFLVQILRVMYGRRCMRVEIPKKYLRWSKLERPNTQLAKKERGKWEKMS